MVCPHHATPPLVTRPPQQLEDYPLRTVALQTVVRLAGAGPRRPRWCQYLALRPRHELRERQRREATRPTYHEGQCLTIQHGPVRTPDRGDVAELSNSE